MPKLIPPLTDAKCSMKPKEKDTMLFDGGGLYLLVVKQRFDKDGRELPPSKLWRLKYRFAGKGKLLALGSYPTVSLSDARAKRDEARRLLANGVDPAEARKAEKAAQADAASNSFEAVALEWHAKFSGTWSPSHAEKLLGRLRADVFPSIGRRPVGDIKPPELLAMLRRIEARGALDGAHRVRTTCSQIFRYCVATGRAERDPAADLRGALPPCKKNHFAAVTDPKEVAALLRAITGYEGSFVVRSALQLAPLTFTRPGELRQAEWSEVDFETEQWCIPASRMKMKQPHIVPLSRQALEILRELHAVTGTSRYLFPSGRSFTRCMSNNAVNAALRRMGYEKDVMVGHGWRATARTLLDEVLGERIDLIEHQLAHGVKDALGRAYNRTSHLPERRRMMQRWADYLDGLKDGAKVLPFKQAAE